MNDLIIKTIQYKNFYLMVCWNGNGLQICAIGFFYREVRKVFYREVHKVLLNDLIIKTIQYKKLQFNGLLDWARITNPRYRLLFFYCKVREVFLPRSSQGFSTYFFGFLSSLRRFTFLELGIVYLELGIVYLELGIVYLELGIVYSELGIVYSELGIVYSELGIVYLELGIVYLKLGIGYLKMV